MTSRDNAPTSVEAAKQKALSLLDRRDYSRAELLRKLDEKGYDAAAAEEAVDRLVYLGFVDDARYAPIVVRHYAAKGYGAQRIRGELQRRGIPKELWDTAMAEMPQQDETLDRLLRAGRSGGLVRLCRSCQRPAHRKTFPAEAGGGKKL